MRRTGAGAIVGVVVGCISACGGSTSGGTPVQKQDFSSQAADAVCDALAGCCGTAGLTYDGATCHTGFEAQLTPQLSNPRIAYDATEGGACIAALRGLGCGSLDGALACRNVFAGTVPGGGSCASSTECARPTGGHASCTAGRCQVEPRGKSGDACSSTCTESELSTSCSFAGVAQSPPPDGGVGTAPGGVLSRCYTNDGLACGPNGTCQKLPALSEPCTFGGCAGDAFCDQGRCAARRDVGGACSGFDACVTTAACDTTSQKCAAKKTDGASCQTGLECQSGSCPAGTCAAGTLATAKSCLGTFD